MNRWLYQLWLLSHCEMIEHILIEFFQCTKEICLLMTMETEQARYKNKWQGQIASAGDTLQGWFILGTGVRSLQVWFAFGGGKTYKESVHSVNEAVMSEWPWPPFSHKLRLRATVLYKGRPKHYQLWPSEYKRPLTAFLDGISNEKPKTTQMLVCCYIIFFSIFLCYMYLSFATTERHRLVNIKV